MPAYSDQMLNDFADKVRWRMRHDRNPLFVTLQDRYALRAYAEERGVPTVPILANATSFDELPMDELPPACMLKATHGSGMNLLRWEGDWYPYGHGQHLWDPDRGSWCKDQLASRRLSLSEVKDTVDGWMRRVYSRCEWAYSQIPPRLVVERYVSGEGEGQLKDYRLYVFDGVARAVSIGSVEYRLRGWNVFFDRNWERLPCSLGDAYAPDPIPDKPASFGEMIRYAELIGEGVDFVRVDFFDGCEGPLLVEVALYPHAGWFGSPSKCPEQNAWLAAQWKGAQWDTGKWPGQRRAAIRSRVDEVGNQMKNALRRVVEPLRGR